MAPKAKILIRGLKVFAYHGCTQREKEEGQQFLIDIELEYDAARAVEADDLAGAVDYDELATAVHDLATRDRYDLIEALASRIGEYIMQETPATLLRVRVRKPHAPLEKKVEEVAVEMVFERDGQG
ncbi:MAG: dihydroneopterin aldolase [Actinomycetota bacterium]|nr:dihydroneopterin aldolase [Actinomycetota bacterium]MDD5666322.1 dihydroneopterin aldolase [Actinomycetota bacterium]